MLGRSSESYAVEEAERQEKARVWLENTLGLEVGEDFFDVLGDGVLLCSIVNTIKPGTIAKVHPAGRCRKSRIKKMENLNNFVRGANRIGIYRSKLFDLQDFSDGKRLDRVTVTLNALEEKAIAAGITREAKGELNLAEQASALDAEDEEKQRKAAEEAAAKDAAQREEEERMHRQFLEEEEKREAAWKDRFAKEEAERKAKEEEEQRRLEDEWRREAEARRARDEEERRAHEAELERLAAAGKLDEAEKKRRRDELAAKLADREREAETLRERSKRERDEARSKADADRGSAADREAAERQQRMKDAERKREEARKKREAEAKKRQDAAKASAKSSASSASAGMSAPRRLTGTDALLYWAKQSTAGYEGVKVEDFTMSWKDGLAFCALVAHFYPKELNFASVKSKTPNQRLELAFEVAGRQGVPPLLDPEDITEMPTPDKRSMITFLGCLYKGFSGK